MGADVVVLVVGEHPSRSARTPTWPIWFAARPGRAGARDCGGGAGQAVGAGGAGRPPLAITRQARLAGAVLYAWHPGSEGGAALASCCSG